MISLEANFGLYPYGVSWIKDLLTKCHPSFSKSFHIITDSSLLLQICVMSLEANFGLFPSGNFLNTRFAFKLTRGTAVFRGVAKANCG